MNQQPYKLAENIKILKTDDCYNIYITEDAVFFVAIDKCSTELKRLKRTYTTVNGIGVRFGLLGSLLTIVPMEVFIAPKIKAERKKALDTLRSVSMDELRRLPGYGVHKRDITFEERKKDRYRIHLGKNKWLLLDGKSTRDLQAAM